MTLEELLAALAKVPDGSKYVEALKTIIATKDTEIEAAGGKNKTVAKAQKEAEKKLKATEEKLSKVLDHLGIDEDEEDLDAALAAADKNGKTKGDDALMKRLDKLEKQRKAEKEESDRLLGEERGKRLDALKRQELLKALNENNAARPEDLVDFLFGKVQVGDNESFTLADDKGNQVKIGDGVKSYLATRPEFTKNSQKPGGGSNTSGATDTPVGKDGKPLGFGAAMAMKAAESNKASIDAQAQFFGGAAAGQQK